MKRALVLLVVGLATTTGVARGNEQMPSITPTAPALPSASTPNGAELVLAPNWMTPPAQPVQLSSDQLLGVWQNAGQAYGVPWNVLAAINKIESNFGGNMGPSSAGALGWMQFIPSTWLRWGTDADRNGFADPWNPVDAIYSAARYLAASGAASDIRRAIFSYNHADWYVNDVVELANLYAGSGAPAADQAVVAPGKLQVQIQQAQAVVTRAGEAYRAALANAQEVAAQGQEPTRRVDADAILSDRLEAQKDAVQRGAKAAAAQAVVDQLRSELDVAQAKLAQLQGQTQVGQPTGAPQSSGSYVFPVAGGPSVVAVSHYHHDYPAADIAAPEGSAAYALSAGAVLDAWSSNDRCGIGFTMQTTDGQVWTYCHLSAVYPSVVQGAQLVAGDLVGLVGHTGDATGPHLHLQLQPATGYPQDEDWFKSFAGTAFQWSDAEASPGASTGVPLFRVLPSQ